MNTAYLDWSLHVECPKCHEETDISANDDDSVVTNAIFHNVWDNLKGYEVTCPHCKHEFELDNVEY